MACACKKSGNTSNSGIKQSNIQRTTPKNAPVNSTPQNRGIRRIPIIRTR